MSSVCVRVLTGGSVCVYVCVKALQNDKRIIRPLRHRPRWLVVKRLCIRETVFAWIPYRCSGFAKVGLIRMPLTRRWLSLSAECWSTRWKDTTSAYQLSGLFGFSAHCEPSTEFPVSFPPASNMQLTHLLHCFDWVLIFKFVHVQTRLPEQEFCEFMAR